MQPSVRVVQPSGLLDRAQASEMRQEVEQLLQEGADLVLLDMKHISFVDSSGLGGLMMAYKLVSEAGGRLLFCSVGEQARMLFELTGVDQVFEVFSNQDEFLKVLSTTPELFKV